MVNPFFFFFLEVWKHDPQADVEALGGRLATIYKREPRDELALLERKMAHY